MLQQPLLRPLAIAVSAALLGLGTLATTAQAQTPAPAAATAEMASGEVTRLDLAGGRLTLKHGEIKTLDMPPMTMVFRVRDKALLDGIAVGDRVRFQAARIDGSYTVTALSKAP